MMDSKQMPGIRASINTECPTLEIVKGDASMQIHFEAMWGTINYKDENENLCGCSFLYEHSIAPRMSEGTNSVELLFIEKKKYQTFTVTINGKEVSPEAITRLGFYASADIGPILVSFAPSWHSEARPLVMSLGGKRKSAPLLRHLGVVWLYRICDKP